MNDPRDTEDRPMAAAARRPAVARSAATVARRLIEVARRRPEVWETLRTAFLPQPAASGAAPAATATPEPSTSRTYQDGRESRAEPAGPAAVARPAEREAGAPDGNGGSDRRGATPPPAVTDDEPAEAGGAGILPAWRGAGLPAADRGEDGRGSGDEPSPPLGSERPGARALDAADSPRDPAPERAGDAAHLAAAPAVNEWLSNVARLSEGHVASLKAAATLLRAQNEAVAELHAELERLHASLQTLGRQTDRDRRQMQARMENAHND